MKSLVLKDLFNIGHNAKSMLFILVVFAVALIPFSGVEGYIFVCAILCSMMIVTTFSFDDSSKWTRYAMIMPVSKKELVAGKFMVLAIFCAIGSLFGLIIGFIGGLITHKIVLDIVGIGELLFLTLVAWVISLIFGSMSIPLVFKFGAEKGRVLLLVSFLIPAGICFGIYQLLTMLGVALTDQIVFMQPPQSIEEIKAGLETTEKGGVRQSIRNCLTVFQRDPLLSGAIAYNILTDRKDIIKPIGFHRESTALNDTDMKYLLLYLEETYGLTNEKKIDNAIGIVANENKYHPIRDYLSSLVWDGTERIRFCLRHFLGADADDYTYEALKLFLLGAISRAFQPGCKFEIMLCLVGGQGAGKSTFFRLLAVRDEWFSDDLRKLDDDNVYRKLQGHWIIEMSEMMATANAKSIEEIKSFLSRQKEVYKIPYETHPADRPRQCVFGGTSNALDFLPLDRSGNRRFIPVMVYPEQAEVHILEDEAASRAYIEQMWAEAMEIYRSGRFKLAFSPDMQRYLKEHQRDFMPEDTKAGMIQAYLDRYTGSMVCSKQLYKEALNHAFDEPKQWEIREINEIMNQCIDRWRYFPNPRMFSEYGRQKGWERENPATESGNPSEKTMDGFVEVTEQMELPF